MNKRQEFFVINMVTKIPVRALIAIVVVAIMIGTVYSVLSPILTGQEVKSWATVASNLEEICSADTDTARQFNIFMPDSSGNTKLNVVFFYLAVDQNKLLLGKRTYGVEKNDYLVQFVDWVRGKPGNKVVREKILKSCRGISICGKFDSQEKCNRFQFEANEGHELLTFTVRKPLDNKIVLSYSRQTSCGDKRCCGPQETIDSCPVDCRDENPCDILTT